MAAIKHMDCVGGTAAWVVETRIKDASQRHQGGALSRGLWPGPVYCIVSLVCELNRVLHFKWFKILDKVVHACNPSTQEAKAGRPMRVGGPA